MNFLKKNGAGLLLCLAIAVPSWFLGQAVPVIGGPVFAILIGMVLTLILTKKDPFLPGVNYTSKKILQAAVVFLGFGMNLTEILAKGKQSLPIIISTISTSLIIAFILYKALKLRTNNAILVGVGSSICGGSAIAATAPVINASDEEVAQSISVIFLFNVLAALIFPTLGAMLGLSNEGFGLFAGTAINDTSSVTAAATAWDGIHGSNTLESAAIVKMTRTLAIIPITLILAIYRGRKEKSSEEIFSLLCTVFRSRIRSHNCISAPSRSYCSAERTEQIPYCHGHGCHRSEYEHRQARKDRWKTDLHRLLLLAWNLPGEPWHAACPEHLVDKFAACPEHLVDKFGFGGQASDLTHIRNRQA